MVHRWASRNSSNRQAGGSRGGEAARVTFPDGIGNARLNRRERDHANVDRGDRQDAEAHGRHAPARRQRADRHWADPETGAWTTTADGDWTGGFWAGTHPGLASKHTGEEKYRAQAAALAQGLKNRIAVDTVFKSFPLDLGAALGAILRLTTGARRRARARRRPGVSAAMYKSGAEARSAGKPGRGRRARRQH